MQDLYWMYIWWRYKNDIAQNRLFTTGIKQYNFVSNFHCVSKKLGQYGTIQYGLYGIRYHKNGKWAVS